DKVGTTLNFPLLGDTKLSLEHIECLLNEYNHISKLLGDGAITRSFATKQAIDNFPKVYARLKPFIDLRVRLSDEGHYASHFIKIADRRERRAWGMQCF